MLEAPGEIVSKGDLVLAKARELVQLLDAEVLPYITLVECRAVGDDEVVVLDLEVELPQDRVHDIKKTERVATRFFGEDQQVPETLALREDFPVTPHQNLRDTARPRSLCLFQEPWTELIPRWTAARYLHRLRWWLTQTARGELHASDQPLEPFLIGSPHRIVLPPSFFVDDSTRAPERLSVRAVKGLKDRFTLIAYPEKDAETADTGYFPLVLSLESQVHGLIRQIPTTLSDLRVLLAEVDADLIEMLRQGLCDNLNGSTESRLLLIVRCPLRRSEQEEPERCDVWAFVTVETIAAIGEDLGLWEAREDHLGWLLGDPPDNAGAGVQLLPLNPTPSFTRNIAKDLSGLTCENDPMMVAIGAGALGSQVILNLLRQGFGRWVVVDEDVLLPHNLARHALDQRAIGIPKAMALAYVANGLLGEEVVGAVNGDIQEIGPHETLSTALDEARVLLDMSASIHVARYLARDLEGEAQRMSLFLNPSGSDMVLLSEDTSRVHRLDELEMQYYRAVARDNRLAGHLARQAESLHYGRTCRDITTAIPQDVVCVHAGIGSRAIRHLITSGSDAAAIRIWRLEPDLSVQHIKVELARPARFERSGWQIVTNDDVLANMARLRESRLPNETGGILLGTHDLARRIVYVVDALPAPPDSHEYPTLFIRGSKHLLRSVEEVRQSTSDMLEYVGEWHSHPDGVAPAPSDDDRSVFDWLRRFLASEGIPALMSIVAEGPHFGWQIDSNR